MRIVHISDVHVRNLKYHDEYRRVFENLYRKLDELKPDRVVNTGDTGHTKTQISPEFVDLTSEHIRRVSEYCDYDIILGNHDMNLMNLSRQDVISPIVESIQSPRVHFHKKSGRVQFAPGYSYWVFSLADKEHFPSPDQWKASSDTNIGLFHGSVTGCVTDSNWRMTNVEQDLDFFDGLDYVFLGDIHKQQFFRDRRMAYPGSLIQQNFGEDVTKGFLLWEISGKDSHTVTPVTLEGSRKFFTVKLKDDLSLPEVDVPAGSRVRVSPPRPLTLAEQKEVEKSVRLAYDPHDVICLSSVNMGMQKSKVGKKTSDIENIRQLSVQEKLLRDYFGEKGISEKLIGKILDLNKKYHVSVEQDDETVRNVAWKFDKIRWSNLFNYGENNVLDFSQIHGLTGLFAPNGAGKSNFIDILAETCFDNVTKGVSKNVFLINDNKDEARAEAEITANDQRYKLERVIERIKHVQKKTDNSKEWGKTTVNFGSYDDVGEFLPLVGNLRPETEKNIRQRLGTFEDFMLTSLSAQWNPLDLIACKETKRKEIFYRFFDLDIFEKKCQLAKEDSRAALVHLKEMEEGDLEEKVKSLQEQVRENELLLDREKAVVEDLGKSVSLIDGEIVSLASQKIPVECDINVTAVTGKASRVVTQIETVQEKLAAGEQKVLYASKEFEELSEKISDLAETASEKNVQHYDEVIREIEKFKIKLSGLEQTEKQHKKDIQILGQVPCGDQFPQCKFLVNAFDAKTKLPKLEESAETAKKKLQDLESELVELKTARKSYEKRQELKSKRETLVAQTANLKLQVENYNLQLNQLETERILALEEIAKYEKAEVDLEKNEQLEEKIREANSRKAELISKIEAGQEEISACDRQLGLLQGTVATIQERMEALRELRDKVAAYEHYIQAMGKDGIAYRILGQKLPLINEEINKILSSTTDFSVFIEHDAEEQSIRFFLQYGQYKSRLLELGGGAEKFLASIAIRTALLNLSTLPKTNMLIIDEGFGKLDPQHLESVNRMFDYLRSAFDHVIIISHLETMRDLVDNIIEITADDEGYSHIEVGA